MQEVSTVEVKKFYETDECEFCGAIQGGYIQREEGEEYINIRDGHYCYECQKPETP